jgi:hypothetical protein
VQTRRRQRLDHRSGALASRAIPRAETIIADAAAIRLGICIGSVHKLIRKGVLPATQLMIEAAKGFRRLKAHKQLPILRWLPIRLNTPSTPTLNRKPGLRILKIQRRLPSEFQHGSGHSHVSATPRLNTHPRLQLGTVDQADAGIGH